MNRLLFLVAASVSLAACNEDIPAPSADVAAFTKEIEGQWESSEISIVPVGKKQSISILPLNNYSCNQISSSFQKKDVVSKFTIAAKGTYICVTKAYTCALAPEQISWIIAPAKPGLSADDSKDEKEFVIEEINEGVVQARYKAYHKGASKSGQLRLEVTYDSKEACEGFIIKLKKVTP
jgi:hypothetical protein